MRREICSASLIKTLLGREELHGELFLQSKTKKSIRYKKNFNV
jgi:hypothetical protein